MTEVGRERMKKSELHQQLSCETTGLSIRLSATTLFLPLTDSCEVEGSVTRGSSVDHTHRVPVCAVYVCETDVVSKRMRKKRRRKSGGAAAGESEALDVRSISS